MLNIGVATNMRGGVYYEAWVLELSTLIRDSLDAFPWKSGTIYHAPPL